MIMHGMCVIHDVYIPRKISFLIGFPELRGMCIEHVVYIPCNVWCPTERTEEMAW